MHAPSSSPSSFGPLDGLRYGLLGLPLAFVALPLYVLLPNHYARAFGVPLAALGAVLLGARLLDALTDPLLGRLSDRLHARSPRAVLGAGAVAAAVLLPGFGLLFFPQWLVDPAWVKPSIVIMTLWTVAGTMVIFLAALKNVPVELYEVASLDGAGAIRKFFSITLPMISGAMFFNVIVLSIAAFQIFDQAYLLFWRDQSNSSPEASLFYAIYLFQQAFRQFNFGFAAAMAWLLFVIIMIITVIQVKFGNRFVYYEGDR